jgi:hypothetical protein
VLTSGGSETEAKDLIARIGALVYSAALARPAGADASPLPSAQTTWSRLGTIVALVLPIAAVAILALAALAAARSARRQARRPGDPMTVWSPERKRPRSR